MKEKELRRMSRRELVDIIYEMKKREQALTIRLEDAERQLEERNILISNAGSIAEAALAINGVFAAAQAAAEDYLRAVKRAGDQDPA